MLNLLEISKKSEINIRTPPMQKIENRQFVAKL